MLSPRRREVIIAGLATLVAPAAFAALPEGRPVEGYVSNRRRDAEGVWRATVALTLA